MRALWTLALLWLAQGCLSFDPPAGRLACATDEECPTDWRCVGDRCQPPGETPDAFVPTDAGPADGGEPDAGSCEEPCDLVRQCGCPTGRGCYPNSDLSAQSCLAAGVTPEGQRCTGEVNACEPGLACVRYSRASLCIRFCDTDADCTGGPGSFCARELTGGASACSFSCDLVEQNCAEGFRCEPATIPPETARTATDCIETEPEATGGEGDSCSSTFSDCLPGFTCASGQCLRFCAFGSRCPSGRPCSELSPAVQIGEQEYGVCPP